MRNMFFASVAAIAIVAPTAAYAQETTSSVRGSVTSNGTPVAGASVTITHEPSGTSQTLTTNDDGSFNANALRVGGPFTVSVTGGGVTNYKVTDIYTIIGQPYALPIELGADSGDVIVVTASKVQGAGSISQGPALVLTTDDIANVASTSRDIRDLARRDPFARLDDTPTGGRAVSFAGQNPRFNRFSVDGVPITDSFGLNPDGLPSRRSPIPLDAIGQFQTKVAPYDAREGNFQGGAINIVLRSGGNEFQGTGFYSYSDDGLSGKKTKPGPGVATGRITLPNFKSTNYGLQLSGPIIKDKLFFMIAGERVRANRPIAEGPVDNNAGTAISLITQAQVDQIAGIAKSRYNYDVGEVLNGNGDKDDRIVAKLDANLSETQRASFTYTYTKDAINLGQNSFPTGNQSLGLSSNGYVSSNRLHTGVFQLNSEWSDEFSTEVRGFYKDYLRGQNPILGRGFGQFSVCLAPTSDRTNPGSAGAAASISCPANFASLVFGPDISRHSNALKTNTWGGSLLARLKRNDHDLKVFFDYAKTDIFNIFLQRTLGDYYFDSIADFQAGNAQRLRYQNAVPSLNPDDAAAIFGYSSYTFGVQDDIRLSDTLNIALGARYDVYGSSDNAALNPNFVNRFGFTNRASISGRGVFQPRIGFDYTPTKRLSLRGGFGIFAGGSPDVYLSNSFSTTGILTNNIDVRQINNGTYTGGLNQANGAAILTNVNGATINPEADAALLNASLGATATTNALDPNFKLPSQWRATLSANYKADLGPLGDGWNIGADFFYSAVRNQVLFTDLRVVKNGLLTPDGRPRYSPVTSFGDTNFDILLGNTKKGRSYVGVAHIDKEWDFGLKAGLSYTYQDIKDQAPATSSTANSNYSNGVFVDANRVAYGISNDQVKHNFKYNLTYEKELFGDNKTTFALFGETRIGHPFSYTFQDTAARSTVFGTVLTGTRYLLYVPTGVNDPLVSFDSAANAAAFDAFVNSSGLSKFRGKVAPRNAFNSKWFTRLDLHIAQELPGFLTSKSKITVFADVDNFTNLLNKKWGQIREYVFPYQAASVRVSCLTTPVATGTAPGAGQTATNSTQACAQYRYTPVSTVAGTFVPPSDTIYASQSLYAIRVGVRFSF
jgi:Carboxypeptidase regulatory-like domain/TonB dependent receptor